jgi:ribosome-binding protein aMBF1 (putative translation factor)
MVANIAPTTQAITKGHRSLAISWVSTNAPMETLRAHRTISTGRATSLQVTAQASQGSRGGARSGHFELAPPPVTASEYARPVTIFGNMLRRGREREGLRLARAAWLLGVTIRELREIEAGERYPSFDAYDRIEQLFGWPQMFVGARHQ